MSSRTDDRGLAAVARVRTVREQDSRLGLQLAIAEQQTREQRLADLRAELDRAAGQEAQVLASGASPGTLLSLRTMLIELGRSLGAARDEVTAGEALTHAARVRWEADRARLAAVQSLLEHRRQQRLAEQRLEEAKQADDIAAQGWLRRRADERRAAGA